MVKSIFGEKRLEDCKLLAEAQSNDDFLKKVIGFCNNGWPDNQKKIPEDVKVYWPVRSALYHESLLN